jgi:hypothetical protein
MVHKTKKLGKGHYLYRGYEIWCVGYYPPEQRVCWECVDEHGHGFGHDYSLKACKRWIDVEIDELHKKIDRSEEND